jgi:hypothetical protein
VAANDHHSVYLARAVAGLTPAGHARVDELLDGLVEAVGGREPLVRYAQGLRVRADVGRTTGSETDAAHGLTAQDVNDLRAGFMQIRDQEPLDDVADWANAVVALLEDEAEATRHDAGA